MLNNYPHSNVPIRHLQQRFRYQAQWKFASTPFRVIHFQSIDASSSCRLPPKFPDYPPEAGAVILPPLAFPELEPEGYNSCNTLNESKRSETFSFFCGLQKINENRIKKQKMNFDALMEIKFFIDVFIEV